MRKSAKDFLDELSCLNRNDIRALMLEAKKDASKNDLIFAPENVFFSGEEAALFRSFIERYKNHEPVSKIINRKSFWNHDFYVDNTVLDPRPETELIVEFILKRFPANSSLEFLDIGTGSGCILLSILSELKNSHGIGIDISADAIRIANKNKSLLKIQNVDFFQQNWNELSGENFFDVIVSNPPYIKTADIEFLDENVKNFDPLISLDGGEDGLDAYRDIAKISANVLKADGLILLEVGYDQAESVAHILQHQNFQLLEIMRDLNGVERTLVAKKRVS